MLPRAWPRQHPVTRGNTATNYPGLSSTRRDTPALSPRLPAFWDAFKVITAAFAEQGRWRLFVGNAQRFYRLAGPGTVAS